MPAIATTEYDAINGDKYEVETCETATGKRYFVRSIVPHGDSAVFGFTSELYADESDAWRELHAELCKQANKPLTTRWLIRKYGFVLTAE